MAAADPYDVAFETVGRAGSAREVFDILDTLTEEVERRSPFMRCREHCSECCGHQVLAGFGEWRVMLGWMHERLSRPEQREIVRRAERLLRDASTSLPTWLELRAHAGSSRAYLDTINRALANLTTPCPLLVDGRCRVYPARPAICRGYGRMMRTEDDAFYCGHILEAMDAAVDDLEKITLPVFQAYHHAALAPDSGDLDEVNLLPIWILAHRAPDGALVAEAHRIDGTSEFPVVDGYWAYDDGG